MSRDDDSLIPKTCPFFKKKECLKELLHQKSCVAHEEDWLNSEVILDAFEHRLVRLIQETLDKVKRTPFSQLVNESIRLTTAFAEYVTGRAFFDRVRQINAQEPFAPVIERLWYIYGLHTIEKCLGDYTEDGFLSYKQVQWLRSALANVLSAFQPDALGFVDGFGFLDSELNSTLGRFDGKVYQALMTDALANPVNQGKGGKAVHPLYAETLKPLLRQSKL
jgi:acyl-CoA oxidase